MIKTLRKFLPRKLDGAPATLEDLARRTFTFTSDLVELLEPLFDELVALQEGPLYPRAMTSAQRRELVPRGRAAALVYDTDLQALCLYVAGAWFALDMTAAP